MASSAEKVGANTAIQTKRFFDLRRPKDVVETIQGARPEAQDHTPSFDVSGLGNPVGRCSIGVEGDWSVSFSTSMTREALRRAKKPDSKPVTGAGSYRNGQGAMEANVTLKVVKSDEGLVAVTYSVEPTFPTMVAKNHGPEFGHIPPATLSFQPAASARRSGGMEN